MWLPPLWFPPSCGNSVVTMCVVTTRYCLDFDLNLTGNDTFCGNHGNHVVSTFEIMPCPPGDHMVFTWKPYGVHMETAWYVHRNHMVSTWKPCGVHVVTTLCPDGNHMVSIWKPCFVHIETM